MKYITVDGGAWKVTEAEFKQGLLRVKGGGEFDLRKAGARRVYLEAHRLEDLTSPEDADYLLSL